MSRPISNTCLLSLGTKAYSRQAISDICEHVSRIDGGMKFIELDHIEKINRDVLGLTENRVQLREVIGSMEWLGGSSCVGMSEYVDRPEYLTIRQMVYSLFDNDKKFHGLVDNQVFRSLHPKLKRIGVKNQRHPIVSKLSSYLLDELSLLSYLKQFEKIELEIALHSQNAVRQHVISKGIPLPDILILDSVRPGSEHLVLQDVEIALGAGNNFGPFDISVSQGEIIGLLGVNGCGKTSLFRGIAGHYPLKSGKITLGGRDLQHVPPFERKVATVFQAAGLLPNISGKANVDAGVEKGAHSGELAAQSELLDDFCDSFGLPEYWLRESQVLSGGQKQMISLARALTSNPSVLLLDEPSASLDHIAKRKMIAFLKDVLRGSKIATLVISHDSELLLSLCDRFVSISSEGQQLSVVPNSLYGTEGFSFSAAKILGLANLFAFDEGEKNDVVQVLDVELKSRLPGAVGFHLPPDAFEQLDGACPSKVGSIYIRGWIVDRVRQGGDELLFLRSEADQRSHPVMLHITRGLVEIADSALVRFRVSSDRVRLMTQ